MLFEPLATASLQLANRAVMAPMTRSRAVDANTPNALMAEYYAQRATAGLIVTEGTSPSPNGLGYPRIPGLFNAAQVRGWKPVALPSSVTSWVRALAKPRRRCFTTC